MGAGTKGKVRKRKGSEGSGSSGIVPLVWLSVAVFFQPDVFLEMC